jgi:hypothetical protein
MESRTSAYIEGIGNLWAKYPWIDTFDLKVFLDGFDAGERYSPHSSDSECGPKGDGHVDLATWDRQVD